MENVMKRKNFSQLAKGVLISLSVSIIGILIFAVVLRFINLSDLTIKIVNQVIKVLSVLFGVLVCLKKDKSKGLVKGACLGMLYTVCSYLLFSILVANFSFGISFIYDLIFSCVVGILCGILFVNLKK